MMSDIQNYVPDWQITRQQALIDLLSIRDSDDTRRRHHPTLEGKPDRHTLIPLLASTFIQSHLLEGDMRAELEETPSDVSWSESRSSGWARDFPLMAAAKRQYEALAGASSRLKMALAVSVRTSSSRLFH